MVLTYIFDQISADQRVGDFRLLFKISRQNSSQSEQMIDVYLASHEATYAIIISNTDENNTFIEKLSQSAHADFLQKYDGKQIFTLKLSRD